LIALGGSVLGVGTDIAGSIRIPASCCGVYGFRPSAHLIPYGGQQSPSIGGSPGISACAGPLATSMRACEWFMEVVRLAEPWKYDSTCLRVPWVKGPQQDAGRPLKLGFAVDDGCYTPSPPMERAMAESMARLATSGVNLVPISLPDVKDIIEDTWSLFALDGSEVSSNSRLIWAFIVLSHLL
jgi:amidase